MKEQPKQPKRCKTKIELGDPRPGSHRCFNVRCRWREGHTGPHRTRTGTSWFVDRERDVHVSLIDLLLLSLPCAVITIEELRAKRAALVAERFVPSTNAETSPLMCPFSHPIDDAQGAEPSVWDVTVEALAASDDVRCVFAPTGELQPFEVRGR